MRGVNVFLFWRGACACFALLLVGSRRRGKDGLTYSLVQPAAVRDLLSSSSGFGCYVAVILLSSFLSVSFLDWVIKLARKSVGRAAC